MIVRIWHGYTTFSNADAYETLLQDEVIPGIEEKCIPGYRSIDVLRRRREADVEFVTMMTFYRLEDVKDFQGDDFEKAYVPEAAQRLLSHWDAASTHYELRNRAPSGKCSDGRL